MQIELGSDLRAIAFLVAVLTMSLSMSLLLSVSTEEGWRMSPDASAMFGVEILLPSDPHVHTHLPTIRPIPFGGGGVWDR